MDSNDAIWKDKANELTSKVIKTQTPTDHKLDQSCNLNNNCYVNPIPINTVSNDVSPKRKLFEVVQESPCNRMK